MVPLREGVDLTLRLGEAVTWTLVARENLVEGGGGGGGGGAGALTVTLFDVARSVIPLLAKNLK